MISCSEKSSQFSQDNNYSEGKDLPVAASQDIQINEISFKSKDENEFGKKSDWIELHNTTDQDLLLSSGDWTISDKLEKPNKFSIPEVKIEANGYLLIWCDKSKLSGDDIHANFKISSKGETISLYHNQNKVDEVTFDSTIADLGYFKRIENDYQAWQETSESTPNSENL